MSQREQEEYSSRVNVDVHVRPRLIQAHEERVKEVNVQHHRKDLAGVGVAR